MNTTAGDMFAALASKSVDPIREPTLRYYSDVGLLNTKALAWPETLQIYSRMPPVRLVPAWLDERTDPSSRFIETTSVSYRISTPRRSAVR